ncbi:MAG: class I SAM-dependent methyltransferase [Pseudomonadales bacterium]|nr:class I SAM-dependent methyltransferase [Pseudomonadales bacterium]
MPNLVKIKRFLQKYNFAHRLKGRLNNISHTIFSHEGTCPICEKAVIFSSKYDWFRDHLLCSSCGSIPRERAIIQVIKNYYPNFRNLVVHESSPSARGASVKLKSEVSSYSSSYLYSGIPLGSTHPRSGIRCEDLENLTFEDDSLDLFITQDVMEHVFEPEKAFKEIARVLKPGGAHIFTVPIINKANPTEAWAAKDSSGRITHLHEPEYHGNPIDDDGSLVTMHWGYDIASYIMRHANTPTTIVMIDNIDLGIRAEYIEVLVSFKL